MSATSNLEAAADAVVEDVRGVLASKELDSVPHIKALRQRVDAKIAIAKELTAEKARIAAKQLRYAAEFFQSLYPQRAMRRFIDRLAQVVRRTMVAIRVPGLEGLILW